MRVEPNSRFADYVTNVAFHLTLSKSMCSVLLAIQAEEKRKPAKKDEWARSILTGYSHFVPVVKRLEDRGLVKYISTPRNSFGHINPNSGHKNFRLTDEGKLVVELIKRAEIGLQKPNKTGTK